MKNKRRVGKNKQEIEKGERRREDKVQKEEEGKLRRESDSEKRKINKICLNIIAELIEMMKEV